LRRRPAAARECYERAKRWVEERREKLSPRWLEELTAFEAEARGGYCQRCSERQRKYPERGPAKDRRRTVGE